MSERERVSEREGVREREGVTEREGEREGEREREQLIQFSARDFPQSLEGNYNDPIDPADLATIRARVLTRQGTLVRSRLISQSHCGLVLA